MRQGFRVVHQETSARGLLEKLAASPCDVALIDFYLPQEPWDGVNYLRRLKRYHPTMALITFPRATGTKRNTQPSVAAAAISPSNGAWCCCQT